jgi:phosphatidate cytidylyltransferase
LGDTLAYFVGGAIGRHKLCPAISPNKTLEGSVASVIGSVGGGALVYALQPVWGGHFPLAALLALGAVCGGLGQAGDLFASLIKRWAGLKDFGALIPGHGGVMDRLDSMLFCAPAVYYCFYFVAGGGIRT